jgi:hypothetical protein
VRRAAAARRPGRRQGGGREAVGGRRQGGGREAASVAPRRVARVGSRGERAPPPPWSPRSRSCCTAPSSSSCEMPFENCFDLAGEVLMQRAKTWARIGSGVRCREICRGSDVGGQGQGAGAADCPLRHATLPPRTLCITPPG